MKSWWNVPAIQEPWVLSCEAYRSWDDVYVLGSSHWWRSQKQEHNQRTVLIVRVRYGEDWQGPCLCSWVNGYSFRHIQGKVEGFGSVISREEARGNLCFYQSAFSYFNHLTAYDGESLISSCVLITCNDASVKSALCPLTALARNCDKGHCVRLGPWEQPVLNRAGTQTCYSCRF